MKAWKFAFLTVSFSYHVCSDSDAFWMAQNSRHWAEYYCLFLLYGSSYVKKGTTKIMNLIKVTVCLHRCPGQAKKHADLTMTLTCLQKIFSVLNHKARLEKVGGGKDMSSLAAIIGGFRFYWRLAM